MYVCMYVHIYEKVVKSRAKNETKQTEILNMQFHDNFEFNDNPTILFEKYKEI